MTNISTTDIVNRVWNYAHVLRDEGIGYGDYVEQLTFLIFLKMASAINESTPGLKVLVGDVWCGLLSCDKNNVVNFYSESLYNLSGEKGSIGVIFKNAENKIRDESNLRKLINLIDKESWSSLSFDIKGAIYEGLLQRSAESEKKGAGQYFTPRPIIEAIVDVIKPKPNESISDPACGTGGFLIVAHDFLLNDIDRKSGLRKPKCLSDKEKDFINNHTFTGNDISHSVTRLCAMNLYLNGININSFPISNTDALLNRPTTKVDIVLANPPFGKKSNLTFTNSIEHKSSKDKSFYNRDDFWTTTSNKQLNFIQHIGNMLKVEGRAAVIVPDNVLFEGGSGEIIRKKLLDDFNLHTILRLPSGIFYAQGVTANVIFFDAIKPGAKPGTKSVWIYDLRTNVHKTLRKNKLAWNDFEEFISLYKSSDYSLRTGTWNAAQSDDGSVGPTGRWREFTYAEIMSRERKNLDIFWINNDLSDSSIALSAEQISSEIIELLTSALGEFKDVEDILSDD